MPLITPEKYCEGGIHDGIEPLVAVVEITHENLKTTRVFVRWSGRN